ncbi:MAG TPA: type II secretion system F family protein [Candidatus Binataceae bacterium]|jgi:tight adherence protein C|nr:type II secretion system F family protein [Candidatus Binataceae bacterium]
MGPLLISIVVFLVLAGAASAIYISATSGQHQMHSRMSQVGRRARVNMAAAGLPVADQQMTRALLKWAVGRLPHPKVVTRRGTKLHDLLVQAGFKTSSGVAIFQLSKLAAAVCGLLLGLIPSLAFGMRGSRVILLTIMGAAIGSFIPGYYLSKRAKNRQIDIGRQLSDVLDLLVVCVEAGLGLLEAIKVVGDETKAQELVIGYELSQVAAEVNSGASLGQALRSLADRSGVADIKPLAATLIQSEQLGAAIGPALRAISDSIRSHRRLYAEEAAQKTTIKILFPLVLMILPAMLLIIIGPAIVQTVRTLSF